MMYNVLQLLCLDRVLRLFSWPWFVEPSPHGGGARRPSRTAVSSGSPLFKSLLYLAYSRPILTTSSRCFGLIGSPASCASASATRIVFRICRPLSLSRSNCSVACFRRPCFSSSGMSRSRMKSAQMRRRSSGSGWLRPRVTCIRETKASSMSPGRLVVSCALVSIYA